MAYVPLATQFGAVYTLTGPNGVVAVFNDPTSGNYVGMLREITGLDSPEVRESADELVEADGGVHGSFYFGRRPITMTALVFGHATVAEREARIDKARRATLAMQADATLAWTPAAAGAPSVFVPVRRQQPFRETGAWNKELQIALVSEFAVIMSSTLNATASTSSGTGVSVENKGSYVTYPVVEVTGVSSNPVITDGHGGTLNTGPSGFTLSVASGETVQFDLLNHSAVFTAGARNGQSANRYINFGTTTVWPSVRGATTETFTLTGGGTMVVKWRHAWV